jgi:hypothetical protein
MRSIWKLFHEHLLNGPDISNDAELLLVDSDKKLENKFDQRLGLEKNRHYKQSVKNCKLSHKTYSTVSLD